MELLHAHCLQSERSLEVAMSLPDIARDVTFGGLARCVEDLADVLGRAEVGRGSRVAVLAPGSVAFVAALFAAMRRGAAAAPIDPSLRGHSLSAALRRLAPDAIIGTAGVLRRLPEDLPAPRISVGLSEDWSRAPAALVGTARIDGQARELYLPLVAGNDGAPVVGAVEGARADDDALLVGTSGSTGEPKYVRLSHGGTLFNIAAHLESLGLNRPFRALQVLDVSYSYGLVASLLGTLVSGGTVVLPPNAHARGLRDSVVRARPEVCLATPALFEYLIDNCPPEAAGDFAPLRKIGIGGDRCREPLRRRIQAFLPDVEAYVTYGTTEAGPRIATLPPELFLTHPNAVGRALRGVDIEIVDSEGRPCGPGNVGFLRVRTPSRMQGYLGDARQDRRDDWLSIGDLASVDDDGILTIHGRADRQFKHRGRRINPAQIESVLQQYPGVVAARVDCPGAADRLRAIVHHRPQQANGLVRHLHEHCRRNLPSRLVPGEIVTVEENEAYFFKGRRLTAPADHT